jgi:hypothetical protein
MNPIIFWHAHDSQKAALEIANYRQAIDRVDRRQDRKEGRVGALGRDPRRRHPGAWALKKATVE